MTKRNFFILILLALVHISYAQKTPVSRPEKPKLVIGLVIDQMRWDFLYRYKDHYTSGGFKRLMDEGFNCNNTLIPYLPTYTAPGHSCIFTGSVPAFTGIVGNSWYDKSSGKSVYCTSDSSVSGVGSSSVWGKMSPRNLWATTIGDELRLSNNFKSKTIAISLKDRASILPGGHTANAAYWYDETVGGFISSTYYINQLPAWVSAYNKEDYPAKFMSKDWNLLLPGTDYTQSTKDNENFEVSTAVSTFKNFPHKLSQQLDKKNDAFRYTPFANTFIFNFAKTAIQWEGLGRSGEPDLLTISISSTDIIGHKYGPNSLEIEDTYLRLDRDIADFLTFLDNKIGKGNYTLFISADHGVSNVPEFLEKHSIPAGRIDLSKIREELNKGIQNKFQLDNEVVALENAQVYLSPVNSPSPAQRAEIKDFIIQYLLKIPYVTNAFSLDNAAVSTIPEPLKQVVINGYNPKRSGDVQFIVKPFNLEDYAEKFGTTHGSWNLFDAHIPLIFFGWGINKGSSSHQYYMTDIAATIASILNIQMPDACVGKVIEEAVRKN